MPAATHLQTVSPRAAHFSTRVPAIARQNASVKAKLYLVCLAAMIAGVEEDCLRPVQKCQTPTVTLLAQATARMLVCISSVRVIVYPNPFQAADLTTGQSISQAHNRI